MRAGCSGSGAGVGVVAASSVSTMKARFGGEGRRGVVSAGGAGVSAVGGTGAERGAGEGDKDIDSAVDGAAVDENQPRLGLTGVRLRVGVVEISTVRVAGTGIGVAGAEEENGDKMVVGVDVEPGLSGDANGAARGFPPRLWLLGRAGEADDACREPPTLGRRWSRVLH